MKFHLALFIYTVSAIFFSCSKSQSMSCSDANYIESSFFNNTNGMNNSQRSITSIYSKEDWNQQYLDTKYSCKEIMAQFFFCNICCKSSKNEIIAYNSKKYTFENSLSITEFTSELVGLLGTMSIGSDENQILNDSINSGN